MRVGLKLFVSRLCIGYFLKMCKEFLKKTVLKNDCSKFSRSKRSVANLSLFLCCLRDRENNLPSTRLKLIVNLIKNVHAPMKPQRVISETRGYGSSFLRIIFELFFQEFSYETHRLIQKRWESAKKFFLRNPCLFFESTLLKHVGEVSFCSG